MTSHVAESHVERLLGPGALVIAGCSDDFLRVYSLTPPRLLRTLQLPNNIYRIVSIPQTEMVLAACGDGVGYICNIIAMGVVAQLLGLCRSSWIDSHSSPFLLQHQPPRFFPRTQDTNRRH